MSAHGASTLRGEHTEQAPCTRTSERVEALHLDLARDTRGYVHPRSEEELCDLVRYARQRGLQLRVRGSAHSVPAAIHTDARLAGDPAGAIEIVLDRWAGVTFDDDSRRVTVQAGCRFGRDPRDPTMRAGVEQGLCFQLEQRGWALPILAGVSHTTVAGMLATGASGGSVMHNLHDAVVSMRIVDGTGEVREISRERDPELFHAAGVSLGLLGIVSTVTLQCVPRFDVIGTESICSIDSAPFVPFGSGPGSLEAFLRDTPYARVLWWPQRGVDKLVVWQARPMAAGDYDGDTGPAWALRARPYRAFDPVLGTTLPLQVAAGAALTALGGWRRALEHVAGPTFGPALAAILERAGGTRLEAALIDAFVPEDRRGPQRFWDTWWRGLPMDDDIDGRLLPTTFTEIWVPLSKASEAMRRLRDLYRDDPSAAGSFVVEVYAAARSDFWLSPAHGEAAIRFNVFWLERNPGDPRDTYFPKFWRALADLGARLHWAKLLPNDARATAAELAQRYPRWNDFARVRRQLDPDGVFLTSYWSAMLGLAPEGAPPPKAPLPDGRPFDEPAERAPKWPPVFRLEPASIDLLDRADHVIDVRGHVPAAVEEVHRIIARMSENEAWVPGYVRTEWVTEPGVVDGAVIEEVFSFMTLRLRVLDASPGRWAATVLASSLPLGTRMVELIEMTASPDGGCDVRWRVAYDLPAALAPLDPVVAPIFRRLFLSSLAGLARHVGRRSQAPSVPATEGSA